ncbi:MAG: hypothetical protein P8168_04525 [Deltaproteobacteria bacterium]|jgi:hypothetical protein
MKIKLFLMTLTCSLVLATFFASSKVEAGKGQSDQVTLSATLLASLSQKGLIQICPGDISSFILVEPLYWKKLTHVRKQKTVQAMINVARTEKNPPEFVIFQDMTSRETLAKGFVKSGRITIYK